MEDQVSHSQVQAEQPGTEAAVVAPAEKSRTVAGLAPSSEVAGTEHRQAYGTAKTENLRDSGLWRILLPAFIVACCLVVLAVPLIILGALLYGAITSSGTADVVAIHHQLIWLWIVMILLSLGIGAVIIRYFIKTFFMQSDNYRKA
jgi:phage shock protein PspC (stress-responsive transcriptional regulator)